MRQCSLRLHLRMMVYDRRSNEVSDYEKSTYRLPKSCEAKAKIAEGATLRLLQYCEETTTRVACRRATS